MAKIIIFFIFLIFTMLFPVYEYFLQKPLKQVKAPKNMALVNIYQGKFFTYKTKLNKKGYFDSLKVFKKYYIADNLYVNDLIKKEYYNAKKVKFENSVVYAYFFNYKNKNYSLNSSEVIYLLKNKIFKGKKFYLKGKDFNTSGDKFLVDRNRNITAYNTIFNLKVNK